LVEAHFAEKMEAHFADEASAAGGSSQGSKDPLISGQEVGSMDLDNISEYEATGQTTTTITGPLDFGPLLYGSPMYQGSASPFPGMRG
jgi:hypothetical protein